MAKLKIPLDGRQHSLFKPETSWRTPKSLPENLLNFPVVALDTETCDPRLKELGPGWFRGDGKIVGVSLAWEGGKIYIPVGHEGGDNFSGGMDALTPFLIYFLKNFTGTLVLMNGFYDIGWLRYHGLMPQTWQFTVHDVMMAEALIDEHKMRYNMESIAKSYNIQGKDEQLLAEAAASFGVDPKGGMWRLPARFVGGYAEQDASVTLNIYHKQLPIIKEQALEKVVQLEHSLLPALMEMRFRGVRVDVLKAEERKREFLLEYDKFMVEIKNESTLNIDVWSADSVALGFKHLSIKYPSTAAGKPSFTDDWLSAHPSNFAKLITLARKAHKAANTFCQNMVISQADKNGRVHAEFHPLRSDDGGTVSGRFSSSNPNLQQVPARDPRMNTIIRGLFLPEEGEQWAAADYSQQEPRLTIHYAAERKCTRGQEAADKYNSDPDTDYHNFVASLVFGSNFTPKQRKAAKTINLGLAYGMGGPKLCRSLGYPTKRKIGSNNQEYEVAGDEGQALLDKYFKEVPFIKELSKHYTQQGNNFGYVSTLSGRRCRFTRWEPRYGGGRPLSYEEAVQTYGVHNIKRSKTHTGLNRKIQGGSADMIKIAIRNLWREGICPLVTVHDENGVSVPNRERARDVAEIMRTCVPLRVPLKVDVDLGPTWGDAKPMTDEDLL